ncbi:MULTISPECIES: cation-translocating P-type ATPase [Mycolicibacterium]|uniref:cation-translocating P-type ATPase n=1 Tax=Mycolicibacterium elephantis TaxID=81858 RepID=UPI0006291B0F|nr:cation-translocating P-type ATPase [Mycolicibacterium elephantis]KKW66665.1 metal ABC transporter ATPase [Mycolicibacterium elephantis]OBE98194.1 magnesium-transporting ATPase [Mycolicibacterium elephantis]
MTAVIAAGLTEAEVAQRISDGKTNDVPTRAARSVSDIVRANVFTRINAILGVLLIIVLSTGSVINGAFGLLIIANSAIGMIQELRAKQTLDKLAIVGQTKPLVRRRFGGVSTAKPLPPNEVVLDDIIELGPGDQIVVDGEVVEESNLEVDESLLTGEADPIAKDPGDTVMSGSFVIAGSGAYRATKVGREAYAAKLAEEASKFTLVNSELRTGINKILQFITYLLIPAGLLIIYTQLFTTGAGWNEAVLRMVGALVPMVPEGLVLMTSIAFAVGVIRLGRRQCLVNELPAIEGLARVDVVCADKTGTLTENGMRVADLKKIDECAVTEVLAQLAADDARPNASMQAIAEAYRMPPGWTATATAPFKSSTKWSGASYGEHGNWVLGAPDVLLEPGSPVAEQAEEIGARGLRVLLLGSSDLPVDHPDAPGRVTPAALVVLEQRIRPDARDTLDYFASQKVSIKVISGDNAVSVGAVAESLGLHGQAIDARELPDEPDALADALQEYTTFGRVRPDQKRAMVHALQSRGHTVAMTGDGVNDVLALKDADIGVAMGSGSSATRAVAQIVLLDNKFATLPYVVGEGRRVIGNIERVSNLFLTKTVYSVLLASLVGLAGLASRFFGSDPLLYPFQPIHVTIAAWFTIGIPAFILSLAPNNERAQPGFVRRVMTAALPSGLVIGIATFSSYLAAYQGREATPVEQTQASTAALITLLVSAVWVLAVVARPYQWWRVALVAVSGAAYVVIFAIPLARELFMLDFSNVKTTSIALLIGVLGAAAIEVIWWVQGAVLGERRRLWRSE